MKFTPIFGLLLLLAPPRAAAQDAPVLTTTEAVRALTREEAQRHLPVRLRGVLTYFDREGQGGVGFVQDETGGLYFPPPPEEPFPQAGELVEITGVTWYGLFSPSVAGDPADPTLANYASGGKCVRLTRLGQGTLPEPLPVTIDQVKSGAFHDQYVKVRGTIRRVTSEMVGGRERFYFEISSRQGLLRANCAPDGALPVAWENTEGEIRAVASGSGDITGALSSVRLLVSSPAAITPDFPATNRAFAQPVRSFAELLRYEPLNRAASPERVHVAGTATLVLPGSGLFLGSADGAGLWVQTPQASSVKPRDRLEVTGFAARGLRHVILEDAIVRVRENGPPLAPRPLTPDRAESGEAHAALVQVEGQLIEQLAQPNYRLLFLEAAGRTFYARIASGSREAGLQALKNGSLVRLTGICEKAQEAGPGGAARWGFSLLLRSPADIAVLRQPPWLTGQRLRWLLAGVAGVALLGFAWVAILRREVAAQTLRIADESGRRNIVEERQRIARELHDTLDQQLTGVHLHLDAAADWTGDLPPRLVTAIVQARAMLQHSRAEARRSIFELRSQTIEQAGLVGALRHSVAQPGTSGEAPVEISVLGDERRLPAPVEFHLLRIAQEAITNAHKHAAARRLTVVFDFTGKDVRLSIADDGCGFDPATPRAAGSGHFGLLGLRERAGKVHGRLEIQSLPGTGTTIAITVPAPAAQTAKIRILLVDDHFFVRMGLAASLSAEPDLVVAGEADSVASAIEQYRLIQPDVTIMDGRLPDGNGVEALIAIRAAAPAARVIMLSIDDTEEDIHRAVEAGALSYLPKSTARQELLRAIGEVAQGRRYFPPALVARLKERRHRRELTPRELEILRLVVSGTPNKIIADNLGIAEPTVKIHISHIFSKLGVQDRTSATVVALRRGLLPLD